MQMCTLKTAQTLSTVIFFILVLILHMERARCTWGINSTSVGVLTFYYNYHFRTCRYVNDKGNQKVLLSYSLLSFPDVKTRCLVLYRVQIQNLSHDKSIAECKNIVMKYGTARTLGSHWYAESMPSLTLLARALQVRKIIVILLQQMHDYFLQVSDAQLKLTCVKI